MKKKNLIVCILIIITFLFIASACEKKADTFAFAKKEVTLKAGEEITPEVDVYPKGKSYILEAENPAIILVEGNRLKGLKPGICMVTGYCGDLTDTLKVIVKRPDGFIPPVDTYYTVIFSTALGQSPPKETILSGEAVPNPGNLLDLGGYRFTGWYADEECTLPFDFENYRVEDNLTIYAGWEIDPDIRYTYTQQSDKWLISGFYYPDVPYKNVTLPMETPELSQAGKMRIDGIDARAFEGNATLEEITIPSSYEIIEEEAFANAKKLKKVTFEGNEETLFTLADKLFYNCSALEEIINLPDSVSVIGPLAFYNTSALSSFNFPEDIEEIRERAFMGAGITVADLEDAAKVGVEAFASSAVASLVCSDNLQDIGADAFLNTPWQNGLLNSNNYAEINNILLKVKASLDSFEVPKSIVKVADKCFAKEGMEIVLRQGHKPTLIPSALPAVYDIIVEQDCIQEYLNFYSAQIKVNILYESSFSYEDRYSFELLENGDGNGVIIKSCSTNEKEIDLTQIFAGKNIKKIKRAAFGSSSPSSYCPNLQIVRLPEDAGGISQNAFNTVIRAVFIDQVGTGILQLSGDPVSTTVKGGFEYKLYVPNDKLQDYKNAYTFMDNDNIHSADIVRGNGLCVDIVSSKAYVVQYLGMESELTIESEYDGAPLAGIAPYAFCGNDTLRTITIADGDTLSIGMLAFYDMYSQMEFLIYRTSPPTLGESAFGGTAQGNYKLYVPAEAVNTYKSQWSKYKDLIFPITD